MKALEEEIETVIYENKLYQEALMVNMNNVKDAYGFLSARTLNNAHVQALYQSFKPIQLSAARVLIMDDTLEKEEFWDAYDELNARMKGKVVETCHELEVSMIWGLGCGLSFIF